MRKWLEKGKQLLKRLEDDFDTKKDKKKESNITKGTKNSNASSDEQTTKEENASMMSRSLEDENLNEIG